MGAAEGGDGCMWGRMEDGITGHHSNLRCLSDSENISLNIYIYITVYSYPSHTHTQPLSPYLLLFSMHRWPPHMLRMAGRGTVTSQGESVTLDKESVQIDYNELLEMMHLLLCLAQKAAKIKRKHREHQVTLFTGSQVHHFI